MTGTISTNKVNSGELFARQTHINIIVEVFALKKNHNRVHGELL